MSEHEHCGCGCCHEHEHSCSCSCEHDGEQESGAFEWVRLGVSLLVLVCAILSPLLGAADLSIPLYILSYLIAGYRVIKGAIEGIIKGHFFGENFLMSIASIGALAIGEFAEGCAVMLLFELGERLQEIAVEKSRRSIKALLLLRPDSITLIKDEKEVVCEPKEAHIGDIFIVKSGDKVALDGEIVSGEGDFDMSSLTGESLPVTKREGDSLPSGCISIDGTFHVRVTEEYENSTVSKMLELIEHAKSKKSRAESFISRFARVYTPIVCILAAAVAFLPPLFNLGSFDVWLYRGLCALAASCPCALVISVPLSFFGGLGAASRAGVLIKGSNYLEALARANTVAFDKTGTLTRGKFEYVSEENVKDQSELYFALAVCEKYSTHPIALVINEKFGHLAKDVQIEDTHTLRGKGVVAAVGGSVYAVGNAALMCERGVDFVEAMSVGSVVYAERDGVFLGSVVFADTVKPEGRGALEKLKKLGISHIAMVSGDKCEVAEKVAGELGIFDAYVEQLPEDKAEVIEGMKANGERVIYVGDGINDAPVLALSDVGVAMGGIGSAAATNAADAVIMGDSLEKLPEVIRIARKTMRIVRQNIVFSLAVKAGIILLAALGFANLWVAVFGDVGVCLIAVLNALRVMKKI